MTGKYKNKILIGSAAVLVVICIIYVIVTKAAASHEAKKESEAAAESEAGRIWVTQMDTLSDISFDSGETLLHFVKTDDLWHQAEDENFPVNQDKLNELADTLGTLEASRQFNDGDSLAAYGLETPACTVNVTDGEGKTVKLLVGSAVDSEYYLKTDDSDTVYTVASSAVSGISGKTLYDFVEMETLPGCTADQIGRMTILSNGQTYEFTRNEVSSEAETDEESSDENADGGGTEMEEEPKWLLSVDGEVSADDIDDSADSLAQALAGLSFSGCVDYDAAGNELAAYGLDQPKISVSYAWEDDEGTETAVAIYVGHATEDGGSYYVQTQDASAVNTITANSIEGVIGYLE